MTAASQFLTFVVGDEEYAVRVLKVREIIELGALTRLPAAPAAIRGVINLRGSVVPVVDLAVRLGLGERPVTRRSCIVVLELGGRGGAAPLVLGLMADSVNQVVELPPGQIEAAPAFGTRASAEVLEGMGRVADRFVPLLDVDRLLAGIAPGLEVAAS